MFSDTFNSQSVFVLNDAWNASSPFRLDASITRDAQTGLTRRETARPYSATPLCKINFSVTLQDDALTAAIGALRALTTEPVVIPFWPALGKWSDRASASIKGGLMIVWKSDWSQYEIYQSGSEPGWPAAGDSIAPALMGFIKPAKPQMLSPRAARWTVDFTESSPAAYALQPETFVFTAGPQPSGYSVAPKLLPFDPDFRKVTEQINIEVARDQIGFDRLQASTFYPHSSWRSQTADYTLFSGDPARMLRFFLDVAAPGQTFWATSWLHAAQLTQDVGSADTVLHAADTSAVLVGDYLSLFTSTGIARKITAKTSNTITINSAPGVALAKVSTTVFPLSLARLDRAAVTLEWKSLECAKCQLGWNEVPPETIIPGNETLGTTIGKLPARVILFEFSRDFGNGTTSTWRFTNYETALSYGGHSWTSADFQCDNIAQSLNLEEDVAELTSFIFSGNPMNDDIALLAEAPLSVTIRFADYDGATVSNAVVMFTGDVTNFSRQGSKLKAKATFGGGLFDTQLPPFVEGVMCNHLRGTNSAGTFLISAGCTLLKADWKCTGLVHSPVSAAFPFAVTLGTLTGVGSSAAAALAGTGIFADWFAFGWLEWGTGAAIQRRQIIGSTVIGSGLITLSLHRYFNGVPNIGDTITFYPGCDGVWKTCKAYNASTNPKGKFNNAVNFGGTPHLPVSNPSVTGQQGLGTQGSKK